MPQFSVDRAHARYLANHIYMPRKLPQRSDHSSDREAALAELVDAAALEFEEHLSGAAIPLWNTVTNMLSGLSRSTSSPKLVLEEVVFQLQTLNRNGDVRVFLVRTQNAGLIIRRQDEDTVFESFEVSPSNAAVVGAEGKLVCTYPGPAVSVPNSEVYAEHFLEELSNFICHMDEMEFEDAAPHTRKAGLEARETRETVHPRYITEQLTAILLGGGRPVEPPRVVKRIGDEVLWLDAELPWRRSSLWLVIRVALQTTLERHLEGRKLYKSFILFIHARFLETVVDTQELADTFHQDSLFCMSAKMSRRSYKLQREGTAAVAGVPELTLAVAQKVRTLLQERGDALLNPPMLPPLHVSADDLERDRTISLTNSRPFIDRVLAINDVIPSPQFAPSYPSRYRQFETVVTNLKDVFAGADLDDEAKQLRLIDFENTVLRFNTEVQAWALSTPVEQVCITLGQCIEIYYEKAHPMYRSDPENMSILYLTVLLLWVAMDEKLITEVPLLKDYRLDINPAIFDALLLRSSSQREQLNMARRYISARNAQASQPGVLSDTIRPGCFAIRYFHSSAGEPLQRLKDRIESDARDQQARKREELRNGLTKYRQLVAQAARTEHRLNIQWGNCTKKCPSCKLTKQARAMSILVHEWPLPADTSQAVACVFELGAPESFITWRDATQFLIVDILSTSGSRRGSGTWYGLVGGSASTYRPLCDYAVEHGQSKRRVCLGSSTKSFLQAHYKQKTLSTSPSTDDVCVKNALRMVLIDTQHHRATGKPLLGQRLLDACTYSIPRGLYANLSFGLSSTKHTSNEVISRQNSCSAQLTLHEWYEFGVLRSGALIQWLNMLRQLLARTLDFRDEAVYLLFSQSILQVGDQDGSWHMMLKNSTFCQVLLDQLEELIGDIRDNWLELFTLQTVVEILLRLLSETKIPVGVVSRASVLLRLVRDVSFAWLQDTFVDDRARNPEAQARIRAMSALVLSTFDVNEELLAVLMSSSRDEELFIQCAIRMHDYTPGDRHSLAADSLRVLNRTQRMFVIVEPHLLRQMEHSNVGVDAGVQASWPAFRRNLGNNWKTLEGDLSRWITCVTQGSADSGPLNVHLNLLNGALLVNGQSIGRLPEAITTHKTFAQIFNQDILDVLPSSMPGMQYMTLDLVHGHEVFFGLHEKDLYLAAKAADGVRYLIPSDVLMGDLPMPLIAQYTHWLDPLTQELAFRRNTERWNSSRHDWLLQFSQTGNFITCGDESQRRFLIDIRSSTVRAISEYLDAIEIPSYQVVTCVDADAGHPRLEVELPRSGFSFSLDGERLSSREVSGFYVDKNQVIGTMIGLRSHLVLTRQSFQHFEEMESCVLIPKDIPSISSQLESRHVDVFIPLTQESGPRVSYSVYRINKRLRRLKYEGIPDMFTRLQQAYLHAITSLCLPDPLTGLTGTELALELLQRADYFSFQTLTTSELELLNLIADLSPSRDFYPFHLRCMETVHWNAKLGPLAQDERFLPFAKKILHHHDRMSVILAGTASEIVLTHNHLHQRALLHSAGLRRRWDKESLSVSAQTQDVTYSSRHNVNDSSRFHAVNAIASMVFKWSDIIPTSPPSNLYESLERLADAGVVMGPKTRLRSLVFHPDLYMPPSRIYLSMVDDALDTPLQRFAVLFLFGLLAYSDRLGWTSELIATIYCAVRLKRTDSERLPGRVPGHAHFQLRDGLEITIEKLQAIVALQELPFHTSPEANLPRNDNESWNSYDVRRRGQHAAVTAARRAEIVVHLKSAWDRGKDAPAVAERYTDHFNTKQLREEATTLFQSCRHNQILRDHANRLELAIASHPWRSFRRISTLNFAGSLLAASCLDPYGALPTILELLAERPPSAKSLPVVTGDLQRRFNSLRKRILPGKRSEIHLCAEDIREMDPDEPYRTYAERLDTSISALDTDPLATPVLPKDVQQIAEDDYYMLDVAGSARHDEIVVSLSPLTCEEQALASSGLWPCLSLPAVLMLLQRRKSGSIPEAWREPVISIAKAHIALQTSRRRLRLAEKKKTHRALAQDLGYTRFLSCYNDANLDWLLLQIDSDVVIRDVQYDVAQRMLPSSTANICLQLNMGEGKSSVITPMVASAVADGQQLARIVVLKTLASQMSLTLTDRLSGMVNRRIYFLPFSRATKMDGNTLNHFRAIITECIGAGGILVAQPEHILSLRLQTIGSQLPDSDSDDLSSRKDITRLHELLNNSRDILDESDEILHVRYQLLYTWGTCEFFDGYPTRWTATQELLRLTAHHLLDLRTHYTDEFALQGHNASGMAFEPSSSFPPLRILESTRHAGPELIRRLVDDVLAGHIFSFSTRHLTASETDALRSFLINPMVSPDDRLRIATLKGENKLDQKSWDKLLLCRGLLGLGVLQHALRDKRHRVDYGLDYCRSLLAVPYRAKDLPSLSAEFAHPDVVVILTCLSYYFTGLSDDQLQSCIRLVAGLDDPDAEYSSWVQRAAKASIPASLTTFKGLNFDSREQKEVIRYLFSFNQSTIDFYLRTSVFPKEAKQFQSRLTCSSWDLVEPKSRVTTGFSGTNDFQSLLPLNIVQRDPDHQLSTNARVLDYLLRRENNHYEQFPFPDGKGFVLHIARHQQQFRMLLDVGAQMLDIDNRELVKYWLEQVPQDFAIAGVYVDNDDRLLVLYRNGYQEALVTSYVSQQLDKCVIYLDDAHTRGIDLRLPHGFRAAVTLGPKVTKDRLVQGCMRMRRLGAGHSVSFFAPPDVDRKIREVARLATSEAIAARDVLLWSISEACLEIKYRSIQWAYQGLDHKHRRDALDRYWMEGVDPPSQRSQGLRNAWIQPDARRLEEMYGFDSNTPSDWYADTEEYPELQQRCLALGLTRSSTLQMTALDEEQEREVAHEIEQEKQVERPPTKESAKHHLDDVICQFVQTGQLLSSDPAISPAFSLLRHTKAELPNSWEGQLWATRDFARTIQASKAGRTETEYMRPVHWVISSPQEDGKEDMFVIVSPFEANALLPEIAKSKIVRLHVFAPRTALAMSPCDDRNTFSYSSSYFRDSYICAITSSISNSVRCWVCMQVIWMGARLWRQSMDLFPRNSEMGLEHPHNSQRAQSLPLPKS